MEHYKKKLKAIYTLLDYCIDTIKINCLDFESIDILNIIEHAKIKNKTYLEIVINGICIVAHEHFDELKPIYEILQKNDYQKSKFILIGIESLSPSAIEKLLKTVQVKCVVDYASNYELYK